MTTCCPCPKPPGGGVTCASNQFAYCHRLGGELRSGCIPIVGSEERPSRHLVSIHFDRAMEAASIRQWSSSFEVLGLGKSSESPRQDLSVFGGDVNALLYEGMDSGRVVVLRGFKPQVFLMRFPSIWSRNRQNPGPNFQSAF
jgi:hypothetical protein